MTEQPIDAAGASAQADESAQGQTTTSGRSRRRSPGRSVGGRTPSRSRGRANNAQTATAEATENGATPQNAAQAPTQNTQDNQNNTPNNGNAHHGAQNNAQAAEAPSAAAPAEATSAEATNAEAAPSPRASGRPRRRPGHRSTRGRGATEQQAPEGETPQGSAEQREAEGGAQPAAQHQTDDETVVPVLSTGKRTRATASTPFPPFPAPPEPQPVPAPPEPPEPTPPTPPSEPAEPETHVEITLSPAAVETLDETVAASAAPAEGTREHTNEAAPATPRKYRFGRSGRLATQQENATEAHAERLTGWRAKQPTRGPVAANGATASVTTPPSTPTPEEPFTPAPAAEAGQPHAEAAQPEVVAVLPPAETQNDEQWQEEQVAPALRRNAERNEGLDEALDRYMSGPRVQTEAEEETENEGENEGENEETAQANEGASTSRRRRRRRRQHTAESETQAAPAQPAPATSGSVAQSAGTETREARETHGRTARNQRRRTPQAAPEYDHGYEQPSERVSPFEGPLPHPEFDGFAPETEEYQSYYPVTQQPAAQWGTNEMQPRGTRSPYGSPEPSYVRGFGPQPYGVAMPMHEPLPRPSRTRNDRDVDAPPMSANQLGNVITSAIQRQTDRLLGELRTQSAPPSMTVMFPPLPSTERVGVFVDVANLVYSARNMRMGLDFGRLLDFLRGNRRLVRAQAYAPTNPDPSAEQMFLSVVKGLGYRITTKNFKTFSSGAKKADMDLDLCMDIVRLVDSGAIETVVLVSGDSDFLPLLEYCSDHGVRVEVAAFEDAASAVLRQSCDLFINLSLVEDIRM